MNNKKTTKRALLSSVLSLVLCMAMLIGTTFAWFTDSVTSGNNIIKSGNLNVELEYWNGTKWNDVEAASDILTGDLWEPGYVDVAYLRLKNAGSLDLKYQLGVNIISETPGVNAAGETFRLSDYIYFDIANVNGETNAYPTREDAMKVATTTTKIASGYSNVGTLESGSDYVYLAMVVYMPTTVGNEANHNGVNIPEINLGINAYATQLDSELDSFGKDYDEGASVTVAPGESIKDAIAKVKEGGVVFLENGVHNLSSGPIVIEDKEVTIVGLGEVTINKNYGNTHIFTVKNGANVTFENMTMDGKGNTREGVYVRWNSNVVLKNVTIKNTGGKDVMIDEASDAATHGEETYSTVNLINSHIEDVAMCASPVTTVAATQNTYVYFNYDADSTVGSIEKQNNNLKPENIYVNNFNSDENGTVMQLYASNDAQLAEVLKTIKTNSNYWNKQVIVNLAAGEYSADHVINQYPEWNGVIGAGNTNNNYATGVAGKNVTYITFVGPSASTYARTSTPAVVFTGNVTVNGFGNAGTGFGTAVATTLFQNVTFDGANSADNAEDYIVMYVKAAANNVTFEKCTFENATHVTLGGSGADGVGAVNFEGCTFNDGGCLSGYVETLNVSHSVVTAAKNGFINKSKAGNVTVENCDVTAGRYFIRTSNSGVKVTVNDTKISMYESEGEKYLVNFRGSGESAEFTDCTIAEGYTTAGVDANSTLEIYNFYETDGVTYYTDGVTEDKVLYDVSSDAPANLTIPEGITAVGGWSFSGSSVKEVVMPSTLTKITKKAFDGSAVEKVTLNEGLTQIDEQAFSKATNLKEINFPSTLTTVGSQAFRLTGMETLTIPATLTNIGEGAFRDMPYLTTLVIEGNATIANYAFRSCQNLTSITIKGEDVIFTGTSQAFSHADNGFNKEVIITVANQTVADRLEKAQSSAKGYILVIAE